ncbi:MAG TPA: transporter, partial [Chlamydiales bacterium]|nr:transporter [Chlamydiales bacterium]
STTVSAQYAISSLVYVRGANAYGGDSSTNGLVRPGNAVQLIVSFEYTLTQNWALALDTYYQHLNRSTFSGNSDGKKVGAPSSEQFSLAPAIEYNFSKKLGIIGGVWFSVASRNTPQFISGVLNLTYTY